MLEVVAKVAPERDGLAPMVGFHDETFDTIATHFLVPSPRRSMCREKNALRETQLEARMANVRYMVSDTESAVAYYTKER